MLLPWLVPSSSRGFSMLLLALALVSVLACVLVFMFDFGIVVVFEADGPKP